MTNPLTKAFADLESVECLRSRESHRWTGDDAAFVARVDIALAGLTIPDRDLEEWRACVVRWGPRSRSALGCLLGFVRVAWDDKTACAVADADGPGGSIPGDWECDIDAKGGELFFFGNTEDEALLAALEAAPR